MQVVADVADAPLGDNKPNFPTPDVNPSNNQDVFKQLGDAVSLVSAASSSVSQWSGLQSMSRLSRNCTLL